MGVGGFGLGQECGAEVEVSARHFKIVLEFAGWDVCRGMYLIYGPDHFQVTNNTPIPEII